MRSTPALRTGVNTGLEFCLAQRTPTGDATTGITRTFSSLTELTLETQDIALKNLSRWAPQPVTSTFGWWKKSSVWQWQRGHRVCLLALKSWFIGWRNCRRSRLFWKLSSEYQRAGAWNGALPGPVPHFPGRLHQQRLPAGWRPRLRHAPDQTTFSSCRPNANSCNTDADDPSAFNPFSSDVPDIGQDYMDYSSLQCYSKFTQGQSDRMVWHLNNVRQSLLGCLSCQTPCPHRWPPKSPVQGSPQTVTIGTVLNFSALATNTGTYNWQIGNGPSLSTALNATIPF